MPLKGVWHEIFNFRFYSWISFPPRPPSIPLGTFWIFSKICGDIREWLLITAVTPAKNLSLKLNNAVLVWSSFGGLRGLWSGCVRYLCTFSWRFQWQYWRLRLTSVAGDSFAERTDQCKKLPPVLLTPVVPHFCKTSFSKFWAVSCEWGFKVSKNANMTFMTFRKFEYGYQNNSEFYADLESVEKNAKN